MNKRKAKTSSEQPVYRAWFRDRSGTDYNYDDGTEEELGAESDIILFAGVPAWLTDMQGNYYVPPREYVTKPYDHGNFDWKLWYRDHATDTVHVIDTDRDDVLFEQMVELTRRGADVWMTDPGVVGPGDQLWEFHVFDPITHKPVLRGKGSEQTLRGNAPAYFEEYFGGYWLVDPEGNDRQFEDDDEAVDVRSADSTNAGEQSTVEADVEYMTEVVFKPVCEKMNALINGVNHIGQGVMQLHQRLDAIEVATADTRCTGKGKILTEEYDIDTLYLLQTLNDEADSSQDMCLVAPDEGDIDGEIAKYWAVVTLRQLRDASDDVWENPVAKGRTMREAVLKAMASRGIESPI